MQGWLRLAMWSGAAVAAALAAVGSASLGDGPRRLSATLADITGTAGSREELANERAKAEAAQAALLVRLAGNESETRHLTGIVRSLAADREELLGRVGALERSLEDVTGSIRRQAAAAIPEAPPSPVAAAEASPGSATSPPATVSPGEAPAAASQRVANLPVPPSALLPELDALEARPAPGVDIGGAANFDGLRSLWSSLRSAHPRLFDGLHPVVTVRESSKSHTADLRLVAGPLTGVEAANRICATLAAAKRPCRLVPFEGQPLALNVSAPRRPQAAAKPRPPVNPVMP
jgi:hypothetical protein